MKYCTIISLLDEKMDRKHYTVPRFSQFTLNRRDRLIFHGRTYSDRKSKSKSSTIITSISYHLLTQRFWTKMLTAKSDFNTAIGSLRHFMSFVVIWPTMRQTWILNIIWFVYVIGFFTVISGSFASAAVNRGNVVRCLEILGQTIPTTLISIKYAFVKRQIKPMKYLLKIMENDWERQNQNSPNDKNTSRFRRIMVTHARGARIFFNVSMFVVMICWSLYIIEPLANRKTSSNHTNSLQFPMNSWYPLPSVPGQLYQVIYTFEIVFGTAMGIAHLCMDSLLIAAVLHLCGQFEILRCCIEEFRIRGRSAEMIRSDLKFIVNRHISLIEAAFALESSFNLLLLVQLLGDTVHICVSGFMLILAMESNNPTVLIKLGLLVTMALQQMFIYSFAGDYLTSQAALIRTAVYNANWYELPPSVVKSFLLIMMRASKPVVITAGKFFPMSLNSFTRLLRSAVSYISVLRAMNADKMN